MRMGEDRSGVDARGAKVAKEGVMALLSKAGGAPVNSKTMLAVVAMDGGRVRAVVNIAMCVGMMLRGRNRQTKLEI